MLEKVYKHLKRNIKLYELLLFAAISITAVLLFKESRYFDDVERFADKNPLPIFLLLILLKVIAIIWPPFPAIIFIIAMLPIIGFWKAFWADYIGELIGSTIAYYIAYIYGYKGISYFLDDATVEKIRKIKVKKGKEFEFLMVLRVLGNTVFEIMCYGAGLLKISFKTFIVTTIISYFFVALATYKLIEGLFSEQSFYINAALIAFLLLFLQKFGSRYIEYSESK